MGLILAWVCKGRFCKIASLSAHVQIDIINRSSCPLYLQRTWKTFSPNLSCPLLPLTKKKCFCSLFCFCSFFYRPDRPATNPIVYQIIHSCHTNYPTAKLPKVLLTSINCINHDALSKHSTQEIPTSHFTTQNATPCLFHQGHRVISIPLSKETQ